MFEISWRIFQKKIEKIYGTFLKFSRKIFCVKKFRENLHNVGFDEGIIKNLMSGVI